MNDHHYLLKILGLSSLPRLITSLLTLVSFPLMLRSVGASEYGIIVYLGAVISILESFIDFGVSSAAGKGIAETRTQRPQFLRAELSCWARLQGLVAIIGLIPFLGVSYLVVLTNRTIEIGPLLLIVVVFASWIAIAANFVRACLRSYLAFGTLAILDTVESIIRSAGWLIVAWAMPNAMGLAVAGLITMVISGSLGTGLLIAVSRKQLPLPDGQEIAVDRKQFVLSHRHMIKESFNFLGLRFSTRVFQSIPLVMFGQLLGVEMVGIIGAFTKLLEMISFPFLTIGNALAVRAQEVKGKGLIAITALWDACFRFIVIAGILTGAFFIVSDSIAHLLMPESAHASIFFSIMSIMILTNSTSCFVATMSDYVGGLRKRVVYLGALAIIQIPVLWISSVFYRDIGAIISYMLIQLLMVGGYIIIAKGVFFGDEKYAIPHHTLLAFFVTFFGLILTLWITKYINLINIPLPSNTYKFLGSLIFYFLIIFSMFVMIKKLRNKYISFSIFEFRER